MEELIKISAVLIATLIGFTLAGVAGFGGGVVILPILVWVFGLKEAIPILAISQFPGTSTRVWLHWDQINWKSHFISVELNPCSDYRKLHIHIGRYSNTHAYLRVMMIILAIFTLYRLESLSE
ncbi:MAG: hypothetical protein Ct9H300mP27_02680 [Chloroflexota bacterium]|nr:MAG: hypothetical protein Ct9H300mP27_02680 [Chloroflexota bacterium]